MITPLAFIVIVSTMIYIALGDHLGTHYCLVNCFIYSYLDAFQEDILNDLEVKYKAEEVLKKC